MLDKKQFELFWVKMGHKVVERTCNINNAFGPGTANECTVQWWFKKFAKETRTLKMRSMVASHQKLTTINWEDHRSWSSYNTWEVAKELNINHSMVIQHLKQIGKVKKLNKWVPCELTKNQTKSLFWSAVFSHPMQQHELTYFSHYLTAMNSTVTS